MPPLTRPWLLRAGKPRRPGSKLQRQIRRRFLAAPGQLLTTTQLMDFCYPRARKRYWTHRRSVWRAAMKMCVCLGRHPHARGRPNMWVLKPPKSA